ncbi:uncharacterized protein AB675_1248 [Cyphellophora attinorum]|uniref:WLM domain-containing protein n=1 Tax=Cyphellophora attinorum TaxID=1664694 RepID=A0A0N1NWK3_9EURO|nr:uncharacterized protein AB675_1248 [Phialophora attinorum]KPI35736.1 hypothetical protein AB675_1248 [Phialophora attinorum]
MKVQYRSETLELDDIPDETLSQLAARLATQIEADVTRVSLFILPKPGLLKHPFPDTPLSTILTPKSRIKLVGTPATEAQKFDEQGAAARTEAQRRSAARSSAKTVKYTPNHDWRKVQEEATYTFHAIEPLKWLPNPAKSKRFLERLANDPGIKASMRKHKFSVGLLTEMDPASHTTHESRTLGLNRNAGEVIELRLRTDAYDGYRDYKVIRKTLCHELSHNVWGEHDANFWKLTREIEKEVDQNDTLHGGHKLQANAEFYVPDDDGGDAEEHFDGGGWTGGDFVLGRGREAQSEEGLSRREIIARAAMARARKEQEAKEAEAEEQRQQR